ncbi:MAG: AAA family ATPase [Gaiellaceae bacterium]
MATAAEPVGRLRQEETQELTRQWRRLIWLATLVAFLTSPIPFVFFRYERDMSLGWALFLTFLSVIAFRGAMDLVFRKMIPWPSLFGTDEDRLKEDDVTNRRRAWFWFFWFRVVRFGVIIVTTVWVIRLLKGDSATWWGTAGDIWGLVVSVVSNPTTLIYAFMLPMFLLFNFVILMGPLMLMGITQIQSFEPGDADWGVRLDDVRGQAEAKEEVRRVVNLWQSGEAFESAGGKRERGLLMLGAPGTGKTMLSKAIATGFNCFAGTERFLTRNGVKTFSETAGTTQMVLNRDGEWVPADIRAFGVQRLVDVELRPGRNSRSHASVRVRATPDHRWVTANRGTVTDLRPGDHVPFNAAPAGERSLEAFIRGFGFGDGTLDSRRRARIRLCGEKDHRYLPLFQEYGHCFVTHPPSFGGDPLVIFNGGHMADWKELPAGQTEPDWLASWLEGYLAADGWRRQGRWILETQDAEAAEFVRSVAALAGFMVVGHSQKAALMTNLGPRSAPLNVVTLAREGTWRVTAVEPAGKDFVYCAVEPRTQTFTLADGILTGNCPFVSIPGSGFAQTFIGMDAVIVRYLARKARRLARKWGGQCIIFIDEIDAVGMRRQSLGPAGGHHSGGGPSSVHDYLFYGPNGALTPTGDLVLETRVWRDKLFAQRAPEPRSPYPPFVLKAGGIVNQAFPGMFGGGGGQLALNQLLVVMDGIGNPRFSRKVLTNRINSFLDATYIIPRRIGKVRLRRRPPGPSPEQIYFIGACNVPIEMLDPALTRPGRMGRHVWFRTPTKQDRLDVFDLYINKVAHEQDLDSPKRRDELARITMGYSPAMIEQVCSMALTHAHHDGRQRFGWDDIVEAMTTVESGTAINIEYVPEETRAVAIHEAGHAVTSHAYMKGSESTRISIRRRGQALGHHMALEKEERFSSWQSEEMSRLVWSLGAMAAERTFYGENSVGVGGDVQSATSMAAWMVGACAMGPEPLDLGDRYTRGEFADDARDRIMKRFERIGVQIMNRTSGGPMAQDPISAVLGDPEKRRAAAILLGQAYVKAYALVQNNRAAVERVADVLIERREIHGDEVLELLDSLNLQVPEVDPLEERSWPKI